MTLSHRPSQGHCSFVFVINFEQVLFFGYSYFPHFYYHHYFHYLPFYFLLLMLWILALQLLSVLFFIILSLLCLFLPHGGGHVPCQLQKTIPSKLFIVTLKQLSVNICQTFVIRNSNDLQQWSIMCRLFFLMFVWFLSIFTKQHTNINKNNLHIINHCHKLLLFSDNKTWKKKSTDSRFDVTMGSFDGLETWELVGLYIQSKLKKILPKSNFVLYQDDGLTLLRNLEGQQTDKVRKNIIRVFEDVGFSLEIETNFKEVDFLHVSLSLWNGTYCPYKKPNNRLLYIHGLSNHPPNIIKQIPNSIQQRLSKNSSNEEILNTAKCEYKDGLKKSGFKVDFKYTKNQQQKPKNRSRNIIWFNPLFNKAVSTNVANFFFDWSVDIFQGLID